MEKKKIPNEFSVFFNIVPLQQQWWLLGTLAHLWDMWVIWKLEYSLWDELELDVQYVWLKTKFYVNSTVMVSGSVRIHSTVYLYTNNGLLGFFLSLSVSFFFFFLLKWKMKIQRKQFLKIEIETLGKRN